MPREKTELVYQFDELSERAKERARDWWREASSGDEWWDSVYSDAVTVFELLGFDVKNKPVKLVNGSTRMDPSFWFDGIDGNGGASFDGTWSTRDVKPVRAMAQYAPVRKRDKDSGNRELRRMSVEANRIKRAHRRDPYLSAASIKSSGRSTSITVDADARTPELRERIEELARDAAYWLYRQLQREYEYQMSDEVVDENIRANEYEFDEEGKRA